GFVDWTSGCAGLPAWSRQWSTLFLCPSLSAHWSPSCGRRFGARPFFNSSRSLILFVAGLVAGLEAREIRRQVELSLRTVQARDRTIRIFGQYVSPQIAESCSISPSI